MPLPTNFKRARALARARARKLIIDHYRSKFKLKANRKECRGNMPRLYNELQFFSGKGTGKGTGTFEISRGTGTFEISEKEVE